MSADGKSFVFKGVDYGGASYNVYAKATSLPRLPRPRVNIDSLAQSDGVSTQGSTFDESRIILECAVTASSIANVETLMGNVAGALSQSQQGPGALILDSHPTRQYTARLVSGIDGELAFNGERFTLEFLLVTPWFLATSATTGGDDNDAGGVTTL